MERLTSKRTWEEASQDLGNEAGYSYIWQRLNALENILGDEYNIIGLRSLIEHTKIIHHPKKISIEDFSTDELVDSLRKRDGVFCDYVKAWEEMCFTDAGVILLVCDK